MTSPSVWALSLAYWLHMLATVAWIGGLVTLCMLVLPAARLVAGRQGVCRPARAAAPPPGSSRLGLPDRAGGYGYVPNERKPQLPGFPGDRQSLGGCHPGKAPGISGDDRRQRLGDLGDHATPGASSIACLAGQATPQAQSWQRQEKTLLWVNLILGIVVLALTAVARAS